MKGPREPFSYRISEGFKSTLKGRRKDDEKAVNLKNLHLIVMFIYFILCSVIKTINSLTFHDLTEFKIELMKELNLIYFSLIIHFMTQRKSEKIH